MRRLIAAALLAAAGPAAAQDDLLAAVRLYTQGDAPAIRVTGKGEADVPSDIAYMTLEISEEARQAPEASRMAMDATAIVLAALRAAGVSEDDIETRQVSVGPRYEWSRTGDDVERRFAGYRAESRIMASVRDFEALGPLVATLADSGATEISGVTFGLDDPGPAQREARLAAVADGQEKAATIAEGLGRSLGEVSFVSEESGGGNYGEEEIIFTEPEPIMSAVIGAGAGEAEPPSYELVPGDITVGVTVEMLFRIGDGG